MNTKLLRQKILDLAIRGKLTEQKKSDGTTKDLLVSIVANVIASEAKQSKKSKPAEPKTIIPLNKDEAPFEIPENWEWVRLGDVCEKITDGTHHSPINTETGDFMYVTAKNIKDEGVATEGITYVSAEVHEEIYARCAPEKGDVLLIKDGATTGVVTVNNIEEPFSLLSSVALLKPGKFFESWFLAFVIRSSLFNTMIRSQMKGVGITRVTLSQINSFELPLPPLAEQQRIVTAIESAFAEITEIENNQELLKKHIKQGRQKILDLAIRGRLTQQLKTDGTTADLLTQIQDERRETNDESDAGKKGSSNVILERTSNVILERTSNVIASEAKQSKKSKPAEPKTIIPLDKNEAPFEIPENWEWVKYGDVVTNISVKENQVKSSEIHSEGLYPVVSQGQNYVDGFVDDFSKIIHLGNIPIVLFGDHTRVVKYIDFDFVVGADGTKVLKPLTIVMPKYLYYSTMAIVEKIEDRGYGRHYALLSNSMFALPPLAEQQRIVAAIESAFTEFDAMEKL